MAVVRYIGDTDRGRATRSTFKQVTRSMFKQARRSTFKQIQNNVSPDEKTRVSKRLRMRKKQRSGRGVIKDSCKRTVDYTQTPIEYGNPSQKLLFLTSLGLVPKEGVLMPPFVVLDRLQKKMISSNTELKDFEKPLNLQTAPSQMKGGRFMLDEEPSYSCSEADIEDLDLELLIYPIDIPEFLEDIEKSRKCRITRSESARMEVSKAFKEKKSMAERQQARRKSPRITEQQRKAGLSTCNYDAKLVVSEPTLCCNGTNVMLVDLT